MEILIPISEIFLLGLIGGSVPGPILTAVFTEVLGRGFKKSLMTVLKALLAESLLAVLVLLFFFAWDIPTEYFYIISFGGAAVLFWLAYQVWGIEKIANDKKEIFTFPKLLLLTVLNGGFWIFWVTICVPRAFELNSLMTGGHVVFLGAFELGWLFSTVGLAFVFSRFRSLLLKKKMVSIVFKIFALLLIFFGLKSIWGSIVYFWLW